MNKSTWEQNASMYESLEKMEDYTKKQVFSCETVIFIENISCVQTILFS